MSDNSTETSKTWGDNVFSEEELTTNSTHPWKKYCAFGELEIQFSFKNIGQGLEDWVGYLKTDSDIAIFVYFLCFS